MRFGRVRRVLVAIVVVTIASIAGSTLTASAAATPSLTLAIVKGTNVKVAWTFDALSTRTGSALEIQRAIDGGQFAVVKVTSRPSPQGSFADKNVPRGRLTYRARLVLQGVAQPFGEEKSIQFGPSTTTTTSPTTTTSTTKPTTTTTTTTTTPPTPPNVGFEWSRQVGGRIWSESVEIAAVAIAPNGTVVTAGRFKNEVNFGNGSRRAVGGNDAFVAGYAGDGRPLWDHVFGGTSEDGARGVAVADDGRIVVVGSFNGTVNFGLGPRSAIGARDGFALVLSGDGTPQWAAPIGGVKDDSATAVAASGTDVYVTGTFTDQAEIGTDVLLGTGVDVYVARYALGTGTPTWTTSNRSDNVWAIAVDSAERVVIGGQSDTSNTATAFLAQYDGSSDDPLWSNAYGPGEVKGIATTADDNIVLTGLVNGTMNLGDEDLGPSRSHDVFVAELTSNGTHRWSQWFTNTDPGGYSDTATGIAVDPQGNVVVTGSIVGTYSFSTRYTPGETLPGGSGRDGFVLELDGTNGEYRWWRRLVALDATNVFPGTVAVAGDGDVLAAGAFSRRLRVWDRAGDNADEILTAVDTDSYTPPNGIKPARTDGYLVRLSS